jgi:hypothetical protein
VNDRDQLTPREVAARTGFSYHAVLRAIHRGDLEACEPIPGRLRIELKEYERWRRTPRRKGVGSRLGGTGQGQSPEPDSMPRRRHRGTNGASYRKELRAIEGG